MTAVLVAVVFALTGFSSSGGGSGGGKSSGKSKSSGGGCSSSKSKKKSHGGSTASASAASSASPTGDPATVVVVTCTGSATPVTTLRFTSRLDRRATFEVDLHREGAGAAAVESTVVRVDLGARETRTVDVALDDPSRAAQVRNCRLGTPGTSGSTASATPKATSAPTSGGSKSTPAPKASKSRKPR
ncbi:hypothetical protein BGK67_19290 [Streptomyces subrutilus]|uniref:Uncharacterized protein n=1 Tax=Streptomyces subrutilus TaxID=36818 RepID=A0A1E5PUX6_9ACTN|nr:hypothetical protein BGK67_19290 [Streptomyces subrutilus]